MNGEQGVEQKGLLSAFKELSKMNLSQKEIAVQILKYPGILCRVLNSIFQEYLDNALWLFQTKKTIESGIDIYKFYEDTSSTIKDPRLRLKAQQDASSAHSMLSKPPPLIGNVKNVKDPRNIPSHTSSTPQPHLQTFGGGNAVSSNYMPYEHNPNSSFQDEKKRNSNSFQKNQKRKQNSNQNDNHFRPQMNPMNPKKQRTSPTYESYSNSSIPENTKEQTQQVTNANDLNSLSLFVSDYDDSTIDSITEDTVPSTSASQPVQDSQNRNFSFLNNL